MARPGTIPTIWGGLALSAVTDRQAWRRLIQNRILFFSLIFALSLCLLALLVPILPLQDPLTTDYDHSLQAPGAVHWLGTDLHGRDILSRTLWAARPSLLVGIVATAMALAAGVAIGGLAAMGRRWFDSLLMRIADAFLSFPAILGAIAIMAVLGPGLRNIFFAIAVFGWPVFARLFRSSVLTTREMTYVKAARVMGDSEPGIFLRNVLPNSVIPLISYTSLAVAGSILAEAGLSFISLGVQRPSPSWGLMLAESRGYFEQAPWLALAPGVAVTLTALIFIFIGTSIGVTSSGNLEVGGSDV